MTSFFVPRKPWGTLQTQIDRQEAAQPSPDFC